jgi:ATP/maltotriose-dependent transcriptional regulator MalT
VGRRFRLEPPIADRTMLVRQRLLERLRARWYVPVTVVSAPAGYGKTTLLSQAMTANALAPLGVDCWLACESDEATASSLGQGLAEAVGAAPPTLASAGAGPEAPSRTALAGAVSEAMWQRSPRQVALVVDDVHEIPAGSEAAALLASIVGTLPANGHIVLAGRGPPPLALARLDVEGRVARLDEADLAFTDAEVTAFAALRRAEGGPPWRSCPPRRGQASPPTTWGRKCCPGCPRLDGGTSPCSPTSERSTRTSPGR